MRSVFNPTRRNRNIGTAKQGHGQNNRLVIPSICSAERSWPLQLKRHTHQTHKVCGRDVLFLVEKLNQGFEHACSIDDICHMLELLPSADWAEIGCILFRQPTLNQQKLKPAWGRMFYYGGVGSPGKTDIYCGPLIILEAQNLFLSSKWSTSLTIEWREELKRLENDGHSILRAKRYLEFKTSKEAVRATQLYRTLLHEIGHWHDYQQKVELPVERDGVDFDAAWDAFFARPQSEREAFAHNYADRLRKRLVKAGHVPFSLSPA